MPLAKQESNYEQLDAHFNRHRARVADAKANQLALAMGISDDDANTFRSADWTDGTNNYAVAHTVAVEQIMDYFALIPVELQSDVVFPTVTTSAEGVTTLTSSDMSKIQVFVDVEPFSLFNLLGLSRNGSD